MILGEATFTPAFLAWWQELQEDESVAARLVHDADKLDLFVQALVYEEQSGNAHLDEFWQGTPAFHFPEAQAIYKALRRRRAQEL
jgi:5'-deoxynucleotidase YfbR-like HD superfamily hydrolase